MDGAVLDGQFCSSLFRRSRRRPFAARQSRTRPATWPAARTTPRAADSGCAWADALVERSAALRRTGRSRGLETDSGWYFPAEAASRAARLPPSRTNERMRSTRICHHRTQPRVVPWKQGQQSRELLLNREWLVTNGLGGYASGTISGAITRSYHGILIAALPAPLGRIVMWSHVSECPALFADDDVVSLGAEERAGGQLDLHGADYSRSFASKTVCRSGVYARPRSHDRETHPPAAPARTPFTSAYRSARRSEFAAARTASGVPISSSRSAGAQASTATLQIRAVEGRYEIAVAPALPALAHAPAADGHAISSSTPRKHSPDCLSQRAGTRL